VGVNVADRLSSSSFQVRARLVINAAGPFAEQLLIRTGLQAEPAIPLSRDMALVLAHRPGTTHALALPTKYRDPDALLSRGPRHLFLVPWQDVTLIGVHSTIFAGRPDSLSVSEGEVSQFLQEINQAAPWLELTSEDVVLVYAGLLPAGARKQVGANVSFGKRSLVIDHQTSHGIEGLVSAVANRFTTARGVAARAVDLAGQKLRRRLAPSRSAVTPLFGAPSQDVSQLARELVRHSDLQLDSATGERMARNHGTNASQVLGLIRETPSLAERLGPSGTLAAEVLYSTRHERASRLADCVFRRTDLGAGGHPGEPALRRCAELMAAELGWSRAEQERELAEVRTRFFQQQ